MKILKTHLINQMQTKNYEVATNNNHCNAIVLNRITQKRSN